MSGRKILSMASAGLLAGAALVAVSGSPVEATVVCPTAGNLILGTTGDDVLIGTSGTDIIKGKGGQDIIKGKGGRDVLYGGPGRGHARRGQGQGLPVRRESGRQALG